MNFFSSFYPRFEQPPLTQLKSKRNELLSNKEKFIAMLEALGSSNSSSELKLKEIEDQFKAKGRMPVWCWWLLFSMVLCSFCSFFGGSAGSLSLAQTYCLRLMSTFLFFAIILQELRIYSVNSVNFMICF